MKKFSFIIMSLLFMCACTLFSACTQIGNVSITLDKTNAVIYLGETENNQVSVLATLNNANAKMLNVIYDTSFINISQKQNDDGTFTITATSKVDIGTNPIAVEVKYGNVSATFYVEIVLPIESIVAQNDLYVAYNGEKTYCNLTKFISFEPEGTKQTGVNFSLLEESDNWYINENQLIINEGLNANDLGDIKITATSSVEGKSDISTTLSINLMPNVKLLADRYNTKITYNGEEANVQNNYELKVEKTKDGYSLSEFILKVIIPSSLGIDVDLSAIAGGGNSTNILNYLSYQKTYMVDNTGAVLQDVYIFTFSLKSKLLGEGDLYLKYWYKDYANDDNLSAVFVGMVNAEIIEKIHVSTVMPITDIKVVTNSVQNPTTKVYTIYRNYGKTVGEMFRFVALPEGTSQKELILEKSTNSTITLFGANGLEIIFDSQNRALINSDDIIYIKGGTNTTEKLTCYSASNLTIKSEIDLNVVAGASGLGFVPSTDSTSTQDQIVLNVEKGNTVSTYIYSPGVINKNELKHNLKEDAIDAELTPNYFKVKFYGEEIGKHVYTISTANGYEIIATINVIQPIEEIFLQIKNNTEFSAGIGNFVNQDNDLINISLQNGYSAQLEFIVNQNAEITNIEYKFYNPSNIDVYGEEFANLKNVKNYNFDNITFDFMSSIINTQNLINSNILTAKNVGVNIIEIKIYGYKADENGLITQELKGTKYLFVQTYNPVKTIESTAKNITLRAENQLSADNKSLATKTLSLKVLSADGNATYDKLFIDGGKYSTNDNNELVCETIIRKSGEDLIKVVYNNSTKQLEITALNVNSSTAGTQHSITLFAGDFVDCNNYEKIRSDLLTTPIIRYIININLIETKSISNINVSNLSIEKEEANTKTYKTIYLDTSKGNVTYRLFTEVEPFDAFDKSIEYTYTANSGETQALVSVSNDGLITVLSDQGGLGYITITPKDKTLTNVKTLIIPVAVLDGNSWETAYEISSLDEITDANKHYVLTIPTLYSLDKTLFENLESGFKGGLYGVRYSDRDNTTARATIKLNKVSLFNRLANTAIISDLNICGDVESVGYVKVGETAITEYTSRGVIANINNGKIDNVKITTYLLNNIYSPSVLIIGKSVAKVGGIVGENFGIISNSVFAGSININGNAIVEKVNAIAGENSGTIANCGVIISKFDASLKDSNRVVEIQDNEITIYTNGIIGRSNKFDDISEQIKEDSFESHTFVDTISIKSFNDELGKHSYGEDGLSYGLVFFYQAQDLYAQNKYKNELLSLNTIPLFDLLNVTINGSVEDAINIIKTLKISALNLDGSVCSFVTIGSDSITINGIGSFILNITSEYDYTTNYQINMLSVYNAGKFTFSANGIVLNSESDILELIKGQSYDLVSKLDNFITLNKNGVQERISLSINNFELLFNYAINNSLEQSASNFITGTHIGNHTINATFDWNEVTKITVKLISGYGENFDLLLNNAFNINNEDSENIITGEFEIIKKVGTTDISTDIKEGAIEPNDTFSFVATLTTDASEDKIDETCIAIINEYNFDVTNKFNIFVEKDATRTNSFKISINANRENIDKMLDYVNKKYIIKIFAVSSTEQRYNVFETVEMTLLPQTISNINSTLYNITTLTTSGINVSNSETPTSVLIPSLYGGLFVVDMFPSYASFDYLEIVATSNSTYKLAFRLQNQQDSQNYSNATEGFSAIEGKNGIRIYNTDLTDINNQNIGKYFIKVFTPTYSGDAVFTITVKAYYNNEELSAKSIFTLYMKMPDAPQLSLNGQTRVYSLAGENIENITCLVANDQLTPTATIEKISGTNNSVVDGKDVSNIETNLIPASNNENTIVGYKKYYINISFNKNYKLSQHSTKFKLVVTSKKITNGTEVSVSSDMSIFIVDYTPNSNDIVIANSVDNVLKVNSIKSQEFSLAELTKSIKSIEEFINEFNSNYYYKNSNTDFTFGTNIYAGTELKNKAEILASYISYVNGNIKTPLLKIDPNGNVDVISNKYLTFEFKSVPVYEPDGSIKKDDNNNDVYVKQLFVKGGDYTGTTEMILEIPYTMPDGRQFTYEYKFEIVHEPYSNGDDEDSRPKDIANVDDFLGMENENEALHFILTNDLYLYDYTTIANTDKIASFDGNNHTIHIVSFAEGQNSNFALFNNVSSNTTIKNLTVNIYHINEIAIESTSESVNIAGFAIQNNGAIYNCEVMTFKSDKLPTVSSTFGIKIDKDINTNVAGFVLTNNGSITNSRVGGTSKLVTSYDKDKDVVISRNVSANMLSIIASGNVSGFVGENNGIISSSFVKNVNIINTYYKQETLVTAGFVNTNNGVISLSYAEGDFLKESDIQSEIGGLQGSGILTGFVYENNNKITDCYSNLYLTNYQEQVGRLGAGFVFHNGENGIIERGYSASKIVSNNIAQMNFAGIKDFGGYNNDGQIKTSYYYAPTNSSIITIESVLNTSITAITSINTETQGNINPGKEFYGFSFKKDEYAGTWAWSKRGPQLVDANDIAHSFRTKYQLKTAEGATEDEFEFLYCKGYEIGTKTNPIIIRNAKEFNLVLGGNTSTEKAENFSLATSKIFGAYRLVNNIDLLELVPQEEQESEYKVNLLSTKMSLTGEYVGATRRNGSFNGNGLSIKNLAISNADTSSDNFGLFKTIENGASIFNLNIDLADAGVSADHTTFVGTLAGSLNSAYAYNITIKTSKINDYTQVIGANVTGGAFGRVVGNSIVSNIELENISAVSTYYKDHTSNEIKNGTNIYVREASNNSIYKEISIAGGAFGVVDIYNRNQLTNDEAKYGAEDYVYSQVTTIAVKGGLKVEAMTVGGIAGYIGEYVIARDLSLTIYKNASPTYLTAYNCYAGGIAGYNKGYLYQIKVEHESDWQAEIESNMYNYYNVSPDERELIDRGSEDIFESKLDYKPSIVGGLVGYEYGGKLSIGYSKLNVINQTASYVGGIIGYSPKVKADENTTDSSKSLQIKEIYAVGDVLGNKNAYVAGLIGYNEDNGILIDKFNAMNYWGKESFNLFKDQGKISATINGELGVAQETAGENSTILSLKAIQFKEDSLVKITNSDASDIFTSYYSYQGVFIDNGAQIDLMFNKKDWYKENNWNRDITETFPHIMYVSPNNVYEISSTSDFHKFSLHWNENATFIVTEMIDCKNWQNTLGTIKGTILGATNECGFSNLNCSLFTSAVSSTITTLTFNKCRKAFVEKSTNTSYSDLIYTNCDFLAKNGNVAGVTYETKNGSFKNISFDDSCRLPLSDANNIGYLFAIGEENITIENIKIRNASFKFTQIITSNSSQGINIGLLFGDAEGTTTISTLNINTALDVTFANSSSDSSNENVIEINVGIIGGKSNNLNLALNDIVVSKEGLTITGAKDEYSCVTNLSVGGLVGKVTDLCLTDAPSKDTSIYFAPKIKLKDTQYICNQYVGTACGSASNIKTIGNNAFYIFGASKNGEQTEFSTFEFSLAASKKDSSNFIGGIAGSVKQISAEGAISYYGDMSVIESNNTTNEIYLNLGGITGITSDSGTIKNVIFEGTITINKLPSTLCLRAGGIIGYNSKNTEFTILNSIASGEITLLDKLVKNQNIAGVVGFNAGTLTLGDKTKNDSIICLTTLFASKSTEGIDAIANNSEDGNLKAEKVKYCSTVTLSVASNTLIENNLYSEMAKDCSIWNIAQAAAIKGSKIRPYNLIDNELTKRTLTLQDNINKIDDENKNLYGFVETTKGKAKERTLFSTYTRKLYATIDEFELKDYQISLYNTVLFGSGAYGGIVKTDFTPINKIDERSAISGIISKIYIDEADDGLKSKNYENLGGLVNVNNGIVYTCSVQERLNDTTDNSTQFFGYINIAKTDTKLKNVGGFVGNNTGKIFGSNCNVSLEKNSSNVTLSGFAGTNSGIISYSYASGTITAEIENKDYLFVSPKLDANNTVSFEGSFEKCYTIVKPTSNIKLSTNLPNDVITESDSIEMSVTNTKNLYGTTESFGSDTYYSCNTKYNYNYPTISNGAFENITYLKRCTMLNENNGTYEEIVNFDENANLNDYYSQIPNLKVLKELVNLVNSHSKFVIISNINVGYTGSASQIIETLSGVTLDGQNNELRNLKLNSENLISTIETSSLKNIKFAGDISFSSNGLIGSTGSDVTLNNVGFTDGAKVTIDTNADTNTTDTIIYGVLVGKNSGTIHDCNSSLNITTTGSAPEGKSYVLGGLVGKNEGIVVNCTFTGSAQIIEKENNVNVTFGAIVGENSKTVTKLYIENGKINNYALTDGGTMCIENKDPNGNLTYETAIKKEKAQSDQIKGANKYSAQIYVLSKGIATVGGIVGKLSDGTISYCSSETNLILVGDEANQMIAYAGGIVGIITGGNVENSANLGDVSAMSVWLLTTNSKVKQESGEIVNDGTIVDINGVTEVYYSNAKTEPELKYDQAKVIYVYREMASLAYAGGIAGKWLEIDNNNNNNILVNYGTISGGFKAIKPAGAIQALDTGSQIKGYAISVPPLISAAGILVWAIKPTAGTLVAHPILGSLIIIGEIVAAASALGIVYENMDQAVNLLQNPTLITTGILGCSSDYYENKDFVNYIFNGNFLSAETAEKISKALGWKDGDNSIFRENCKRFVSKTFVESGTWLLGEYNTLHTATEGINEILKLLKKLFNDIDELEVKNYEWQKFKGINASSNKRITKNTIFNDANAYAGKISLSSCNFDGICPDLSFNNTTISVYSALSFKTGNYYNQKLGYSIDSRTLDSSELKKAIENDKENWSNNYGKYSPQEPLQNVDIIKNDNGRYSFELKNAKDWKNLVYTINNTDSLKDKLIDIKINLTNGETEINVGNAVLEQFNGSITSAIRYKFTNLQLTNGLIKNTSECELKNIKIEGNITFRSDETNNENSDGSNKNSGIVFGNVSGENINISTLTVLPKEISFTNEATSSLTNFGVIIGNVDSNVNVNISSATLGSEETPLNIMFTQESPNANVVGNFGVIIGNNQGIVTLNKISTYGNIAICSQFNNVGGIIGSNAGTLTLQGNDELTLNTNLKVASISNTYVGGLLGTNTETGIINIRKNVRIGNLKSIIISADVLSEVNSAAYAGGLVGNINGKISMSGANIIFGNDNSGYDNVSYILAGYNVISNNSDSVIYPSNSNASFTFGENDFNISSIDVSHYNFVVKHIKNEYIPQKENKPTNIQWTNFVDSENKQVDLSKVTLTSADSSKSSVDVQPFKIENDVLSGSIETYSDYGKILKKYYDEGGKEYTSTINYKYSFKPENGEIVEITQNQLGSNIINGNKIKTQTTNSSVKYQLVEKTGNYETSALNSGLAKVWELKITYTKSETQYHLSTANVNAVYKFKIELIYNNARLNDDNAYIKITQLNDFVITEKTLGTIITKCEYVFDTTPDNKIDSNPTEDETIISEEVWSEIEVNNIIFSKNIKELGNEVIELNNLLNYNINEGISNDNQVLIASLISEKLMIQKSGSSILLQEQFNLNCLKMKTTKTEGNTTSTSYTYNQDITRTLLTIDASVISTKIKGEIYSEFSDATNSTISATINSESLTINDAGGNELKTYNSPLLINNIINVDYFEPYYQFGNNDGQYQYFNVYKYNLNDKEYVIISLIDKEYNVMEYVYLVTGGKFECHGYISYTIDKNTYDNNYNNKVPDRYESMFPVDVSYISNIQNNLTINEYNSPNPIGNKIYLVHTNAQVDITAKVGDLFYCYQVTYTAQKQEVIFTANSIKLAESSEDAYTSSDGKHEVYISSVTVLNGLITAEKLTTGNGLKIYSDSGEEGNISIDSLPDDIDKIENCTKYYVYGKTENNVTTNILLGYKIEITSDDGTSVAFYKFNGSTGRFELTNVTNDGDFEENLNYYKITNSNNNGALTAVANNN